MPPLVPEAEAFLKQLAIDDPPGWQDLPLADAREAFKGFGAPELAGPAEEILSVEDDTLAGVPVRIYRNTESADATPVVYFHGGGWVLGNIDTHDALCRRLAAESEAAIISVEYRLAPETKFPGQLDDCYAVTEHVALHSSELNVDASKLVVAGDSAGGNLAAAVAIRARDKNGPKIAKQILIYPVVSPNFGTDSYKTFADGHGLTRDAMIFFWESYIEGPLAQSPALADLMKIDDLTNLPLTAVVLATHDVLADEVAAFANRLIDAGVQTTVATYPGNLHGFVHFAGLFPDGLTAAQDIARTF